jgi:elongation factor P--(R)-beta-lysine ligase
MPTEKQIENAKVRAKMNQALRDYFVSENYLEVETPNLIPIPGMEPHINPFETKFIPETGIGKQLCMYLHTSPEYAMKRLLSKYKQNIFQICKTYRNGEISKTHNPEFTMLEFYRPFVNYEGIMAHTEAALSHVESAINKTSNTFQKTPYERISVRDAVLLHAGIDIQIHNTFESLLKQAKEMSVFVSPEAKTFDDVFFHIFLERVEHKLGFNRPTFLIEYPSSQASLARLKPGDSTVAERVELYVNGIELGNGFSELVDAVEQRKRLTEEQAYRKSLGKPVFPLDEKFLESLKEMPESAGIAIGLDRVLMLLTGATEISDVLLFPAGGFV